MLCVYCQKLFLSTPLHDIVIKFHSLVPTFSSLSKCFIVMAVAAVDDGWRRRAHTLINNMFFNERVFLMWFWLWLFISQQRSEKGFWWVCGGDRRWKQRNDERTCGKFILEWEALTFTFSFTKQFCHDYLLLFAKICFWMVALLWMRLTLLSLCSLFWIFMSV